MSRYRSAYYDPDGERYGVPTYPWQMAPAGLATRRQLAAKGLRPGGQPVSAQVMWRGPGRGPQVAYLYRLDLAKPKRTPTPAQLAALGKARAARCRCRVCGRVAGYVLPRHWDACLACDEDEMRVGPADYDDAGRCWL